MYFAFQAYFCITTCYEELIFLSGIYECDWAIIYAYGLVKNLALMVYIIVGSTTYPILEFLEEWGTNNFEVNGFLA